MQASVQRCRASVDFLENEKPFFPPTINDKKLHEYFKNVAGSVLGIDKVKDMAPVMGSEDFAFYQEEIPGYFFFIGMQNETRKQLQSPHSPLFEINEDVLPYGAALHASLAVNYLLEFQPEVPLPEEKRHDEL